MSGSRCGISIYQFVLNPPRSVGGRVVNNESEAGDVGDVDFGVGALADWRWILNVEHLLKKCLIKKFKFFLRKIFLEKKLSS